MKKNNFYSFVMILLMATAIISCNEGGIAYNSNKEYVMFADSLVVIPVTENAEKYYEIKIGTNRAVDFDVTYPIEVVSNKSLALDGVHFDIDTRNVTIKAGETKGSFLMKGNYAKMDFDKEIYFTLNIINPIGDISEVYGSEMKVVLKKIKRFNVDDFVGDLKVRGAFPFSTDLTTFYCKSEKVSDTEIRILDLYFNDKSPFIVKFHDDDENIFNNEIEVKPQFSFVDPNYGAVLMRSMTSSPSFYMPQDKAFVLYLEYYLDKVGSFGVHPVILEWVSPHEVEEDGNDTGTPYSFLPSLGYKLK